MAHICENCKFRAHYDQKPDSMLGKFFAEQSDHRSSAGVGISTSALVGEVILPGKVMRREQS